MLACREIFACKLVTLYMDFRRICVRLTAHCPRRC